MSDIEHAANIGPVLARELRAAGIATLEELRALGAERAWQRLGEVWPERRCAQSLLALAGAIRGVRWMSMAASERQRLSAYAADRRTP